jgi:alpha-methylacyl-CoA racemase
MPVAGGRPRGGDVLTVASDPMHSGDRRSGPGALHGLKVLEFAGIGPVPFAAMMLADHGADVIRIDRPDTVDNALDPVGRGRRSVVVNVKSPEGLAIVHRLLETVDIVLEGYRPGVMERLGLGPEACLHRNPRLIYGRLSGWGRRGPLAGAAGRDISYLALTGALSALGARDQPPPPPLNLVGDYGGGAMSLIAGVLMALFARMRTQRGQVVDASILAGATSLTGWIYGQFAAGAWVSQRGTNLIDGGAPFYRCYKCCDGNWIAVGAIDAEACRQFLQGLGIAPDDPLQGSIRHREHWPAAAQRIAILVAARTRDEWIGVFSDTQACVAPVLSLSEAPNHPQNLANENFQTIDGIPQPGPIPSFSDTPAPDIQAPGRSGADTLAVLGALGISPEEFADLAARGIVR